MRIGNLDHLMIKLDAELFDDARYIDIRDQISNIIDNAPTIDISGLPKIHYDRGFIAGYEKAKNERAKGKWIYERDSVNSLFRCSNCGRFNPYDTFVKENDDRYTRLEREDANRFCWHCGADMRGDENNDLPQM